MKKVLYSHLNLITPAKSRFFITPHVCYESQSWKISYFVAQSLFKNPIWQNQIVSETTLTATAKYFKKYNF